LPTAGEGIWGGASGGVVVAQWPNGGAKATKQG